jgi:hypothetical protein
MTYIVKAEPSRAKGIKQKLNVTWESKVLEGLIFIESDDINKIINTDGIISCREEEIGTFNNII